MNVTTPSGHLRLLAWFACLAVSAGCGSPPPGEICTGEPTLRVAIQRMAGDTYVAEDVLHQENGVEFLFVDGTCRFWVKNGVRGSVRTGVLDEAAARELSTKLDFRGWSRFNGNYSEGTPPSDAGSLVVWSEGHVAECSGRCGSPLTPSSLKQVETALNDRLLDVLWEHGAPLEAGPLRFALLDYGPNRPPHFEWPLDASPENFVLTQEATYRYGRGFKADGTASALLRELHAEAKVTLGQTPLEDPIPIRIGEDRFVSLVIRDSLPFEDDQGLIRPSRQDALPSGLSKR